MWGSQSWLQPPFRRLSVASNRPRKIRGGSNQPSRHGIVFDVIPDPLKLDARSDQVIVALILPEMPRATQNPVGLMSGIALQRSEPSWWTPPWASPGRGRDSASLRTSAVDNGRTSVRRRVEQRPQAERSQGGPEIADLCELGPRFGPKRRIPRPRSIGPEGKLGGLAGCRRAGR